MTEAQQPLSCCGVPAMVYNLNINDDDTAVKKLNKEIADVNKRNNPRRMKCA